jgi:hypothetical protein
MGEDNPSTEATAMAKENRTAARSLITKQIPRYEQALANNRIELAEAWAARILSDIHTDEDALRAFRLLTAKESDLGRALQSWLEIPSK